MKTLFLASIIYLAHGWYSQSCCGDFHCHPVPCDQLVETDSGSWKYLPRHLEFYAAQVWPSQDRYCHICSARGPDGKERPLCAYIQQGS
jgi:hypothetical protein